MATPFPHPFQENEWTLSHQTRPPLEGFPASSWVEQRGWGESKKGRIRLGTPLLCLSLVGVSELTEA